MVKWKPKVGDKVEVECDFSHGEPRWNYGVESEDCQGYFITAEVCRVRDEGCTSCVGSDNTEFVFKWSNNSGHDCEWEHCTCISGLDFPGAPKPVGKFIDLKPVSGPCTCDDKYMANNGCQSARGLPCVNGKWEPY